MKNKRHVVFISIMVVICLSAHAHADHRSAERFKLATLYFKDDSTVIAAEFENDLKKARAALAADPDIGLHIEGDGRNSDTPEKKRALSQKRAEAVRQWLVAHGVDTSRLVIKNPADPEPKTRKAEPKDPAAAGRVELWQVRLKRPLAHVSTLRFEFAPVMEGEKVIHDFVVQNQGSAVLEIQKVRTD